MVLSKETVSYGSHHSKESLSTRPAYEFKMTLGRILKFDASNSLPLEDEYDVRHVNYSWRI